MFKRFLLTIYIIGAAAWGLTSCSLNIPPQDQFSDPDAVTNVADARSLLASAYIFYPHFEYEFSLLGNDFCPTSLSVKDLTTLNLYNWQDLELSKLSPTVWASYYATVALCDALLERLPKVVLTSSDDTVEKARIEAETKALKALCYLQLMRIYAPAYDKNAEAPGVVIKHFLGLETNERLPLSTCAQYVKSLLDEAEQADNPQTRNGWISQTAVKYLQAELALYTSRYEDAARYAQSIITDAPQGIFTADNLSRLWAQESFEGRIFAFNTNAPVYAALQYSASEGDHYALNPNLVFNTSDHRSATYNLSFAMSGQARTLLGKYNMANKAGRTTAYINCMRYAGAYYIAAEALCRIGNTTQARTLMNDYWQQVGHQEAPANVDNTQMLNLILHDKQREFAGEGVNFFDLKRTHSAPLPRLSQWGVAQTASIDTDDYRWCLPLPASECRFNANAQQNPGWPSYRD